jgi:biotin carboxylase
MITQAGPVMIELGARMGGDNITTALVPLSTGVDMVKAAIEIALGTTPDIRKTLDRGSAIRYFDVPFGIIKSISGAEQAKEIPGVKDIVFTKGVGERSTPIHCSNDRIGFVIAQGRDADEAIRICEEVMRTIIIGIE